VSHGRELALNFKTLKETNMQPTIAQKAPYAVDVQAGKTYYWCSCGKSKSQPFCDGSHQGSEFAPMPYTAEKSETKYFCGCKMTANKPFCDGAHSKL
jgi:CDGSH-type Zn-finger protein